MTRTEVTVSQYQDCVDSGSCAEPEQGPWCNWNVSGRSDHPVNCVTWYQAQDFCGWAGGRLASEAEWEYAARSGGQDIAYPWGDDDATCDYAVMYDDVDIGCGERGTWPVCSKPAGNSDQGLCDMAGNTLDWVEDDFHETYDGAPTDGSAWVDSPRAIERVCRGGGYDRRHYSRLRATFRWHDEADDSIDSVGIRCVR